MSKTILRKLFLRMRCQKQFCESYFCERDVKNNFAKVIFANEMPKTILRKLFLRMRCQKHYLGEFIIGNEESLRILRIQLFEYWVVFHTILWVVLELSHYFWLKFKCHLRKSILSASFFKILKVFRKFSEFSFVNGNHALFWGITNHHKQQNFAEFIFATWESKFEKINCAEINGTKINSFINWFP